MSLAAITEATMTKVLFFVVERLIRLMIACNLKFKDAGSEELEMTKLYLFYQFLGFELMSYLFNRLEPNQLKAAKFGNPLKDALEAKEEKQLGFIYKRQGEDKWILRCTLCGSHTYVDDPPWPEKLRCRVCRVLCAYKIAVQQS